MKKIKKALTTVLLGSTVLTTAMLTACTKNYEFSFAGDGVDVPSVSVTEGSEFTLEVPTRAGYLFEGWYTNPEFTGDAVETFTADSNVTFYAKWSKVYTVNLELNGGVLSTATLSLKPGENVKNALSAYTPTNGTATFSGWFLNGTEVPASYVMPNTDITLTAKYTGNYSIENWVEKLDGTGYELVETVPGNAAVGSTVTAPGTYEGCTLAENSAAVSSITVSANTSTNVLKQYFTRNTVSLTYNANYPDGDDEVVKTSSLKYGQSEEVVSNVSYDGYILAGWATSADGEVVYAVDNLDVLCYNKAADAEGSVATITPTANTQLYAVWIQGAKDMFGGSDSVFVLSEDSTSAYLCRGGVYFKGEYDPTDKSFVFEYENGDIALEGVMYDKDTFIYASTTRSDTNFTFYSYSGGANTNIKVYFDEYNGLTYSVKNTETGVTDDSKGTYEIKDGFYYVTFTTGSRAGETTMLTVGTLGTTPVFLEKDAEQAAIKDYPVYYVDQSILVASPSYTLTLDGYGRASFGDTTYVVVEQNGIYYLLTSASATSYTYALKVVDVDGIPGVVEVDTALNHAFTNGSDTLTFDGVYTVTYTSGTTTYSAMYSLSSTMLGYAIATYVHDSVTYKVIINTDYTYTPISAEYAEFIYTNGDGGYYFPFMTFDDATHASMYAWSSTSTSSSDFEYVKVSTGTYVLNSDGTYTYTATEFYDVEIATSATNPDASTIKSVTFEVMAFNSSFNATLWHSYTTVTDDFVNNAVEYTYADQTDAGYASAVITIIGTSVTFDNGSSIHFTGTIETDETTGISILTLSVGNIPVVLNEDDHTFIIPDQMPYKQYELIDLNTNKNEYFDVDMFGNFTYVVVTEAGTTTYTGTITDSGNVTVTGAPIMHFESDDNDLQFDFIELSTSSAKYFAKYDASKALLLTGPNGETLHLDGCGFEGLYTDASGTETDIRYALDVENHMVEVAIGSDVYIFDYNPTAKTYTVRGDEAGTYVLNDNQTLNYQIALDGYGKATVVSFTSGAAVTVDENATYTLTDKNVTVVYTDGSKQVTIVGTIGTMSYNGSTLNTIEIAHEEVAYVYVDSTDWSVLEIDEYGYATMYDYEGYSDTGSCVIISDNLLYYVNDEGTAAYIYEYDKSAGTIVNKNQKAKGYFTNNFESLLFTSYGVATSNASTRYYYNVVDGNVYMYKYDASNASANEYGYVEINFGKFTNTKEFEGKDYYINTGLSVNFARVEATKNNYPVAVSSTSSLPLSGLSFTPSGEEFSVNGVVAIGTSNYNCVVTRVKNADNTYTMTLTLGYYVFGLNATYAGIDDNDDSLSTYEITSMEFHASFGDASYYDLVQLYYEQGGMDITSIFPNVYGEFIVHKEYNTVGEVTSQYATSTFTNYVDSNNNALTFENMDFEETSSGYIVALTGKDGYDYEIYFMTKSFTAPKAVTAAYPGYIIRDYEFTSGEYTVLLSQMVQNNTESTSSAAGDIIYYALYHGDTELTVTALFAGEDVYFIEELTNDAGKVTGYKYYFVETTSIASSVEDDDVPVLTSASVTVYNVTRYDAAQGSYYMDVTSGNEVLVVYLGSYYIPSNVSYNADTNTYTFTVTNKSGVSTNYSAVIVDGVVTFTIITA